MLCSIKFSLFYMLSFVVSVLRQTTSMGRFKLERADFRSKISVLKPISQSYWPALLDFQASVQLSSTPLNWLLFIHT